MDYCSENYGFYDEIFKRKSFHRFRNTLPLTEEDLSDVQEAISRIKPLYDDIKAEIKLVKASETSCKCNAEYCLLFYSQQKGEYLRNIGYMGEQLDLFLVSKGIGTLWLGMAKAKESMINGLPFVIMIAISKVSTDSFRADMFKAKRKALCNVWQGESFGVADVARFAPSACNSQPWFVISKGQELSVYRSKKEGRIGLIPVAKISYYNNIDMGIYLYILETCLHHEGHKFTRELFDGTESNNLILCAKYTIE